MDCQRFSMKEGFVKCEYFGKCHELRICLCEGDTLLSNNHRPKKTPWATRRQQILEFASQHETIDTTMIMEHTNGARTTACNWLRRLTKAGDLQRLTRAVLCGAGSQPATFALPQED